MGSAERALLSSSSDEAIVVRILAGQVELFELLMRRNSGPVYRAIQAVLHDAVEAEDVMQDAFIRAYEHLNQFQGRARFSTWLTHIALHEAFARIRKRSRFQSLDATCSEPLSASCPEQQASDMETRALIQDALAKLPDEFRAVFELRLGLGMSGADAAKQLGIAEETVKTRLHRARGRLQDLLEGTAAVAERPHHDPLAARCERVVGAVLRRIPYRPQRLPIAEALARGRALQKELEQRRSCRLFSDEPIPREAIDIAIRCASTAPSGANRQPWRFVVIGSAEIKRAIRDAVEQVERRFYDGAQSSRHWREAVAPLGTTWQKPYLETVPWLVVVFAETHVTGTPEQNYHVSESVGIACGLFVVALHRMGLSTLPYTPTSMDSLGPILGRPANEKPFLLFPVGYPARDATVPDLVRKPIEQVAVFEGAQGLPARDAASQTGT